MAHMRICKVCAQCQKKCKQPGNVIVVECPHFEAVEQHPRPFEAKGSTVQIGEIKPFQPSIESRRDGKVLG